jgi:hypothetical protein
VFGPAFLNAYALERDIADFPRIIADQATHEAYEANPVPDKWDKFTRPALRHDEDGPVFVDVLASHRILEGDIPERVLINGRAIRASIQNHLNNSIYTPAHYKKARWMALYWNAVRELTYFDQLEPISFPFHREFLKQRGLDASGRPLPQ